MKTLEGEINSKQLSYLGLLARHYFPNNSQEIMSQYAGNLVNDYKNLKELNPEDDKDELTWLSYQMAFNGLVAEGEENCYN